MRVNKDDVRRRAEKELDDELFDEAVEVEKVKIRKQRGKSWFSRVVGGFFKAIAELFDD